MEKFTPPKLPAMLDGSVMCVDANAWNALIEYINGFVDVVNGLSEAECKDSEAIIEIAKDLKEHLEE